MAAIGNKVHQNLAYRCVLFSSCSGIIDIDSILLILLGGFKV